MTENCLEHRYIIQNTNTPGLCKRILLALNVLEQNDFFPLSMQTIGSYLTNAKKVITITIPITTVLQMYYTCNRNKVVARTVMTISKLLFFYSLIIINNKLWSVDRSSVRLTVVFDGKYMQQTTSKLIVQLDLRPSRRWFQSRS